MATTTADLITQLEELIANGLEDVTIGDKRLKYRSISDLQAILSQLKRKETGTTSPFQFVYAKSSNGL